MKCLTAYVSADGQGPKGWLFMMDSDDERMGDEFVPIVVDCFYREHARELVTQFGRFHVAADWSVTPMRVKNARKV